MTLHQLDDHLEVIYGAAEPKTGALVSTVKALESPGLNHRFEITSGVLEEDCRAIIQEFFRNRRRTSVDRAERYN